MKRMADTTSGARSPPDNPLSPSWVRVSRTAGLRPPRLTRPRTGRPWHQGCRTPGRCDLLDPVARRPRSTLPHPQLRAYPPFAWHPDPRQVLLLPGQARSVAQLSAHGSGPTPTVPRYDSGGHSHPVRIHAYLSCSTVSFRMEAFPSFYDSAAIDNAILSFRNAKVGLGPSRNFKHLRFACILNRK